MKKFNKFQEEAIHHGDGPCLVLAGPGSGKTTVLTNRILYLVKNGIIPESILVITFTRASVNEMKDRFLYLLNEENMDTGNIPTFGTFHSVFYEILKESFGYNSQSLIDNESEDKILYSILEKEKELYVDADIVANLKNEIRTYKLAKEKGEDFKSRYFNNRLFLRIYNLYQEKLYNTKKLDFSDMIEKCGELLSENEDILIKYQGKYKYFLIDEFQDINKSQYDVIKLLCKSKNIFVVGDDDQSIYKFRGSHPRIINNFLKDFSKSKIINLSENYRCAKSIVKYSKLLIDNNIDRFDKDLKAHRDDFGNITIKSFTDSIDENEYIIDCIRHLVNNGYSYNDIAILYRTNLLSNSIKSTLNKYNISFTVKSDSNSIYDNFAVKDILAYMRLAINDYDTESLLLIANKPLRYISRDSIGYKKSSIYDVKRYYKNKDYILKYLTKLEHDIKMIKNMPAALAIHYICMNIGYDGYLKKYCIEKSIDYEEISDIIDSLSDIALEHKNISEFIEYIDNESKNIQTCASNEDSVKLMTFHLSKGLEFKTVFIIDASDGLIPHKKSIKDNDIETERRLFYVAMTRAKDDLHILFTTKRFGKDYKPSRFIIEMMKGELDGEER